MGERERGGEMKRLEKVDEASDERYSGRLHGPTGLTPGKESGTYRFRLLRARYPYTHCALITIP